MFLKVYFMLETQAIVNESNKTSEMTVKKYAVLLEYLQVYFQYDSFVCGRRKSSKWETNVVSIIHYLATAT